VATVGKIKCFTCGKTHDFYFETRRVHDIQCPYCYTYMPESTSDKVLQLMAHFADVRMDLQKWAASLGEPRFKVDLLDIGD